MENGEDNEDSCTRRSHKPESAVHRSNILIDQSFRKCAKYRQHHSRHKKVIRLYLWIFLGK